MLRKILTLSVLTFSFLKSDAQFTNGNLVALRSSSNSGTRAVELVEYPPAGGASPYSVAIPATTAGARLTIVPAANPNTFEGMLSRSADGRFLTLGGFDLPVSQFSSVYNNVATTKIIARVNAIGAVAFTPINSTSFTGANTSIREVVTVDGSAYWVANQGSGTTNGLQYFTHGNGAGTSIDGTSYKSIAIVNNELFVTSGGAMAKFTGVLPTSASTAGSIGASTSGTNNTQFLFLDMDPEVSFGTSGHDVLYIADAAANNTGAGIHKYSFNGSVWTFVGTFSVGSGSPLLALTGKLVAGKPVLYVISGNAADNSILSITDNSARTVAMTSENTVTAVLATAGATSVFKGIAFAPYDPTLPLDLTSFKTSKSNGAALLQWTTASEKNVKEFVLEKRTEFDAEFSFIATIPAKNVSAASYNYSDATISAEKNYYRLKMVDNDGSFKYSDIQLVQFEQLAQVSLTISPNPVTSSINVSHDAAGSNAAILVYSLSGALVSAKSVALNETRSTVDASSLSPGSYVLVYRNKGQQTVTRFIK